MVRVSHIDMDADNQISVNWEPIKARILFPFSLGMERDMVKMNRPGELDIEQTTGVDLKVVLSGSWKLSEGISSSETIEREVRASRSVRKIVIDAERVNDWDSGLLTFLVRLRNFCIAEKIEVDGKGLPQGAKRLLELASATPAKKDARRETKRTTFLVLVGNETVALIRSTGELLEFVGEAVVALAKLFRGKAKYLKSDVGLFLESCGPQALPIVTLICFLVGLILAFIGAIQLKLFGAQIYVADLVGIAMVRLMGAIMAGIVMAGRTGGAFAAQLGTMQVNQEIDALKTLGISPMEFLVLPRMLALALMMPLLALYANAMGILGGAVVGVGMLDIGVVQYYNQTVNALNLWHFGIGIFSSVVFGVIVALAGCMRGMQCGRSASAVGDAATSAVVTAIVGIIVSTALITVLCSILGI